MVKKKMSQGIYSLEQIVTLKSEKEGEEERLPFKRISHLRMAHRIFFSSMSTEHYTVAIAYCHPLLA